MKKVLSIVLSLVMVICMMPVMAFAATSNAAYSDISGEKCEGAVNVLDALGVVDGYEDGTYRPDQTVTRAEMAKLIITALGVADYASATNSSYSDMALAQWAIPYVEYATNLNIVEGVGGGRFSPGNPVTYEQAATMIVRALGFTDECNEMNGTWPAIYVQKATALGLFNNVSNGGSTGANRGDIAVMLYNALTVPEVYADNDGQTNKKVGSDGGDVTMMDTLNVNGSSEYKIVTNADADTAVNSIAGYVGAAAEVIYNQDGDVLALSDIKTTFLTGKYKSNGKFEADNGTTYSIASDAYKVFSDKDKGTVTSAPEDGVVTVVNNISSNALKKFVDDDADNTFTVAATVSGKTITGIYSIGSWTVSAHDKVDSSDISQIERNQKLLSKKFPLNDDQEIDTGAFILNGVDSLDKIEADNVVYVYEGDGEITRIDVGTETVTGTISKKSATKVTIDGTSYELADKTEANNNDLAAGNEVTLYLDYAGDIYDAELVDGTSGNFAVVVAKSDDKPSSSAISGTAKVELLTADGDKVFEINGKKYEDNSSLEWTNVTVGKLVKYSVNDSGQITKLTAVETGDDYEVKPNQKNNMNITKAGYLDGHSIADSALIFAVPTTGDSDNLAFDYSDSDDFSVVKKSSVLDTTLSLVSYVVDKDTNRIVCMIMDDSATSEDTYGIVTSTYEIDGGDGADFYIGSEKVSDGEVDSGTPETVKNGAGLFKITKTTSGAYKFEAATTVENGTSEKAAYEVKNDYVQLTQDGTKFNLYGSAVVYVYDKSEDEYSIGTASDMTDDDVDSIKLYQTSKDTKDDDYGLVNYIVITMK